MLEKRRYLHGYVAQPYTATLVITTLLLCCFTIWMFIETPRVQLIEPDEKLQPSYVLLVPDNVSSSALQQQQQQQQQQQETYTLNNLSVDDETKLIDLNNFKFIINHDLCNKTEPLLLIMVHTAPKNYDKRLTIRETWGKKTNDVVILFLTGVTDKYHDDIIEENKKYNDIIQGNFIDAYRNMTYKHVMTLKWATYYCSSTKYILKVDDDVFINVRGLIDFIKYNLSPWGARRMILCDPLPPSAVKRTYRSKWRVSPQEYPGRNFPGYCAGYAILYSPDSVFLLYREAQKIPYFWIDDVHITGTVAINVNLTHESLHSYILRHADMIKLINNSNYQHKSFIFGPPDMTEDNIKALHRISSNNTT